MGKPCICELHGPQLFTTTSPRFAAAILRGGVIPKEDICKLTITSRHGVESYLIDVEILSSLGIEPESDLLTLEDRDKSTKKLNDRVAICKIFDSMKHHWVCPICLQKKIEE